MQIYPFLLSDLKKSRADDHYRAPVDGFPALVKNHMPGKVLHEITYPFPNFNGYTIEVYEWISNSILRFKMEVITYPLSKLSHVSKMRHRYQDYPRLQFHNDICGLFAMMTSSNGNIFRVTGPLCGEFTGPGEFPTQRPVTRSFDVSFDLRLNKRLSKQPWGWWFETPSWSLWRHRNAKKH